MQNDLIRAQQAIIWAKKEIRKVTGNKQDELQEMAS